MNPNRPARLNRAVLAVLGSLLLLTGAFVLLVGSGAAPAITARLPVSADLPLLPAGFVAPTWLPGVGLAAAVVVGLAALWWLVAQTARAPATGTWQLADFGTAGPLSVTVDPYAGIRYTYLDIQLDGKLDLPDLGINTRRTGEQSEHWVDPIVGLRTAFALGEHWNFVVGGDVGGISTSDQYSAEAWSLVGYRFGLFGEGNANLFGGYRVLKQKYEDGSGRDRFDWDMTMHGPIVGLKITF